MTCRTGCRTRKDNLGGRRDPGIGRESRADWRTCEFGLCYERPDDRPAERCVVSEKIAPSFDWFFQHELLKVGADQTFLQFCHQFPLMLRLEIWGALLHGGNLGECAQQASIAGRKSGKGC